MSTMIGKSSLPGPCRSRAQDVDRHVAARMRERRIMLGLTQQQMAELIGVTYQQSHKYEKGINRIASGRLYNIAQALGVDVGYFFDGLENDKPLKAGAAIAAAAGVGAQRRFHRASQDRALNQYALVPVRPAARWRH